MFCHSFQGVVFAQSYFCCYSSSVLCRYPEANTVYCLISSLECAVTPILHCTRTTRSWTFFIASFSTEMCRVFPNTCDRLTRTCRRTCYRRACCIIHWWQAAIANIRCIWKIDAFNLFAAFFLLLWCFSFLRVSIMREENTCLTFCLFFKLWGTKK